MTGAEDDAKAAWIKRVLGVEVGATSSTVSFGAIWEKVTARWRAASDAVDGQIGKLQGTLRATTDPDLKRIADAGLNGITGDHKVPVLAALQEIDAAGPEALRPAAARARPAMDAFISHLTSDPRVEACDRNPFGITVTIRATLVPALQDLSTTLQSLSAVWSAGREGSSPLPQWQSAAGETPMSMTLEEFKRAFSAYVKDTSDANIAALVEDGLKQRFAGLDPQHAPNLKMLADVLHEAAKSLAAKLPAMIKPQTDEASAINAGLRDKDKADLSPLSNQGWQAKTAYVVVEALQSDWLAGGAYRRTTGGSGFRRTVAEESARWRIKGAATVGGRRRQVRRAEIGQGQVQRHRGGVRPAGLRGRSESGGAAALQKQSRQVATSRNHNLP